MQVAHQVLALSHYGDNFIRGGREALAWPYFYRL